MGVYQVKTLLDLRMNKDSIMPYASRAVHVSEHYHASTAQHYHAWYSRKDITQITTPAW